MIKYRMLFSRILCQPSKQLLTVINKQLHYDVVIIGGGVMGSSSAFFIKEKAPSMKVAVVERDRTYSNASSPKSIGSIREQFSNPENIKLSQWSHNFLKDIANRLTVAGESPPDISLLKGSYMFLASDKGKHVLQKNCEIQRDNGVDIRCLDAGSLEKECDWINVHGVTCGSMYNGSKEGFFDPWSFLMCLRKKAEYMGVKYFDADCVCIEADSKINNVKVVKDSVEISLECSSLVNASGPWAGELMEKIGVKLPVEPRKRYVYAFDCPKGPGRNMPLVIDPVGVYCRPEGNGTMYLCGCSPKEEEEPDTSNLDVDYDYFDELIWPILAHRFTGMEELKLRHSWAGFYDYNTLDQNGIIGVHNEIRNLYFANGFSGHGIQQSPAVGNAISELITDGKFTEIDLSNLSYDRIVQNIPFYEINIV